MSTNPNNPPIPPDMIFPILLLIPRAPLVIDKGGPFGPQSVAQAPLTVGDYQAVIPGEDLQININKLAGYFVAAVMALPDDQLLALKQRFASLPTP